MVHYTTMSVIEVAVLLVELLAYQVACLEKATKLLENLAS